jgi:hypothetical protein
MGGNADVLSSLAGADTDKATAAEKPIQVGVQASAILLALTRHGEYLAVSGSEPDGRFGPVTMVHADLPCLF